MAKTIVFSIPKGGVGKTTTTGIIAYLLSQENNKVLVVDMDSQGNISNLLTGKEQIEYEDETIMDAFRVNDARPYILKASENIDVLPADDFLALLPQWLYGEEYAKTGNNESMALKNLLKPLQNEYDYILIDAPPSLSEATTNSIACSDFVVVLAESSKWAYTAIPRFLNTVEVTKETFNPNTVVLGILRTMIDPRRSDSKAYVELIGAKYPEMVFDTVIKRNAATGRLAYEGFFDNKKLKKAIHPYKDFYEELKNRMGAGMNE